MMSNTPTEVRHLRVVIIDSKDNFKEGGNVSKVVKVMTDVFNIKPQLITADDFYNKFQIMDLSDYADTLFIGYSLAGSGRKGPSVVEALRSEYDCSFIVGWSEDIDEVAQAFIDAGADQVTSKSDATKVRNLEKILANALERYEQDCLESVH